MAKTAIVSGAQLMPASRGTTPRTPRVRPAAAKTTAYAGFRPTRNLMLVDDDAADVLAVEQVVVALVDLVEGVGPGDDLVQLEVARLVEAEDLGDVGGRVAVAEQAALDRLAEQGQDRGRQVDVQLEVVQAGDDDGAALADHVEGVADDLGVDQADGDDGRVRELTAGELGDLVLGLGRGGERVGGAELERLRALVLERVHRDHVLGAGVFRALDRVDADAADAVDHDGVPGVHVRGVHRRPPAGRDAAADEYRLLQRQVVIDLDGGVLVDQAVLA